MNRAGKRFAAAFWLVTICFALAPIVFSQVYAYVGDESLHLVAAQLINAGKRPYIDFFYHHTPLLIYLLAWLMRALGESWRVAHAFSSVALACSIVLACCYARDLFTSDSSRLIAAALAGLLIATNCYALIFATTALPYGFCLFCLTAALYLAREDGSARRLLVAGLCAGAAVVSYLLTLPALLALAIWVSRRAKAKALAFVAGSLVAGTPLLILLAESPSQVLKGLFEFHLFYRPNLGWRYNLRELSAWFMSLQGAILAALSITGLYFRRDDKVRLCGWVSLAIAIAILSVKSIDAVYLLLVTPFAAILAAVGAVEVAHRLGARARLAPALIAALYLAGLYGMKYVWRWEATYTDHRAVEAIARDLESYTPRGGEFYAFEAVYFASRRVPPPTLENRFNPFSQSDNWLKDGRFDAICIGSTNPRVKEFELFSRYRKSKEINLDGNTMYIFWERF